VPTIKKLPSLNTVLANTAEIGRRFPLAVICTVVGTVFMTIEADEIWQVSEYRFVAACLLGLPLGIALVAFAERQNWSKGRTLLLQGLAAVPLILYFFSLPADPLDLTGVIRIRFALFFVGVHILVAALPFTGASQSRGYWEYNVSVLLRALTAALFAGILFAGFASALAAIDYLFGIDIADKRYFQLWVLIAGLFATGLFLGAFPKSLGALEDSESGPAGLRKLVHTVLVPIVILYFLILFAYAIKIVAEWNWPKGWVSQLILWYSVVGLMSVLLLNAFRSQAKHAWIKWFTRGFFVSLIPFLVMLFLAIMRRISDYGITEGRYLVFIMAIGLSVVAAYFVFARGKDLRIIPVIACVLAFLSAFGPWSAFAFSYRSQQGRLEEYITRYELLSEDGIQLPSQPISSEDRAEMSSIVSYLLDHHGTEAFEHIFSDSLLNSIDSLRSYDRRNEICLAFGFEYLTPQSVRRGYDFLEVRADPDNIWKVQGFDYVSRFNLYASLENAFDTVFVGDDSVFAVTLDGEAGVMAIRPHATLGVDDEVLIIPLADTVGALNQLYMGNSIPAEYLTFASKTDRLAISTIVNYASGSGAADSVSLQSVEAALLWRIK
jgi:hypothetical protein